MTTFLGIIVGIVLIATGIVLIATVAYLAYNFLCEVFGV